MVTTLSLRIKISELVKIFKNSFLLLNVAAKAKQASRETGDDFGSDDVAIGSNYT